MCSFSCEQIWVKEIEPNILEENAKINVKSGIENKCMHFKHASL